MTELLRISTGDSTAQVIAWTFDPMAGGTGGAIGGTALYRFSLKTANQQSLTIVLKILYSRPHEDQSAPYYWKREFEVYQSGILADLPENTFAAPRIYRLHDYGDSCWIWMEDIQDEKQDWTLHDYHNIAFRLGRFNGAWLCGRPLPAEDWLTHNWHAAIVPALADAFDALEVSLENPLAQLTLPIDARHEIEAIWRDREVFRSALGKLPQTFCHIDAFRRNLLHRADQVVLLDWAVAGSGAIGEDLVSLVAVSLYYDGYSPGAADRLDEAVFAGYIKGMRKVGWHGEEKQARIGYTCAMVLRGLAGVKQDINLLINPDNQQQPGGENQSKSLEEIAEFFAAIRRFRLLKMAQEARNLLSA